MSALGDVDAVVQDARLFNLPAVRTYKPPTSGPWFNVTSASDWQRSLASPTVLLSPMLYVLDFNDVNPTVEVLDTTLRHFAAGIRSGAYGASAMVVSCQSPAVRHWVELWAATENLPIYLSASTTSFSLIQAQPAMSLSATERSTLKTILDIGGAITAPQLARQQRLKPSAAINRLNSLEGKGLLFRRRRPGRQADLYVDFRTAGIEYAAAMVSTSDRA